MSVFQASKFYDIINNQKGSIVGFEIISMVENSELLEMIKVLKQSEVGDQKKLEVYTKLITNFGKTLDSKDHDYIVDLFNALNKKIVPDSEKSSKNNIVENIEDVREKVNTAKSDYSEKINSVAENYKDKAKSKVEESRFKLVGGQFCKRCETKLGLRKNKPEKSWGIQGNLCKSCFEHVKVNVTEFPALYKQGKFRKEDKVKGKLSIQNFDNVHRIVYGTKEFPQLEVIQVNNIKKHELVNYEEYCKTKKIMTMGLKSTVSNPHLLIQYFDNSNREQEMILYVKDLSNVYSSVGNLVFSNQKKTESKQQESLKKIKE